VEFKQQPLTNVTPTTYTIHFELDRYNIDNENYHILQQAAEAIKANDIVSIKVDGYCDRTGTEQHNNWLSRKRAEAVKGILTELGVDSKAVSIAYHGKHNLAVYTPEGVPEKLNRRTVIELKQ
jgi:peptidoglycan-associated lipoprotein